MISRTSLLALAAAIAGCGGSAKLPSIEVRPVSTLIESPGPECEACEERRLRLFDGTEMGLVVEKHPALEVSSFEVRLLAATEMRTMTEPHVGYWEVRALVGEAAQSRADAFARRHPGRRILATFDRDSFAVSDTELLREALVVSREPSRAKALELSLALGAPTEWFELDEEQWERDQMMFEKMLETEPMPGQP